MTSTLDHAVATLATFGIDVEPARCDPVALRDDATLIRRGELPPHLAHLERCPPRFAADLLETLAAILSPTTECPRCGAPSPWECECKGVGATVVEFRRRRSVS